MSENRSHRKRIAIRTKTVPWKVHMCLVLAVGVLFRLAYDVQLPQSIFFGRYVMDSLVLHTWALDILKGHGPQLAFFRAPLYPYLVALLYRVFGDSPWPVVILQNLCGLGTGLVVYGFARRLFGPRPALWAGLITVAYPTFVYFEGEVLITTLTVLLYTLSAWLLYEAIQTGRAARLFAAGLVFGLSAIARPTILPLAILLPVGLYIVNRPSSLIRTVRQTSIFVIALLLPILPVTVTNLVRGHEFVLISSQGGVNFYIGNNRNADGITVVAPGPNNRLGQYNDNVWTSSVDEATRRLGHHLSQSEVSSYWLHEGLKDILADPVRAVGLYFRKLYLFFHGQEIFNNKSMYYAGEYSILMKLLVWKRFIDFPSGLFIPLALAGLVLAMKESRLTLIPALFIGLFAAVIAAFFVCSRFRQPVMPLILMFAAYGLYRLFSNELSRGSRVGAIVITGMLILALNLGGNVESADNQSVLDSTIGQMYIDGGNTGKGIEYLNTALLESPDNMMLYDMIGKAYIRAGKLDKAGEIYARALAAYPSSAQFNFGMAVVTQTKGERSQAIALFQKTLHVSPDYAPAHERLGYLFTARHQLDSALIHYEKLRDLIGPNEHLEERIRQMKEMIGRKSR